MNDGIKTPCYIIKKERLIDNVEIVRESFAKEWGRQPILGYSVKTNNNETLMQIANEIGMLAEVVSDDEYRLAQNCGFSPQRIIFNGPQKSEEMLYKALQSGSIVNLDNFEEIYTINRKLSEISISGLNVGLRVNFDLEKLCPGETTAGEEVSRFGFCVEDGSFETAVRELQRIKVPIKGLHMHYSSKTRSRNIFKALSEKACEIVQKYELAQTLQYVDIGGGLYLGQGKPSENKPSMQEYAEIICQTLQKALNKNVELILEPGASLLATAVDYICRVNNARTVRGTKVLTTNGSTLHINPFLAKRSLVAEVFRNQTGRKIESKQIICGATCMENDRFMRLVNEQSVDPGDYLVVHCVGAYTMVFNNSFINTPPYIYCKTKDSYKLVRDKEIMIEKQRGAK